MHFDAPIPVTAPGSEPPAANAANYTLGSIAQELNRTPIYLSHLQTRFALPRRHEYSSAYRAFLRSLVYLRIANIAENDLHALWILEKKLLSLLHYDSSGSATWFLDSCGQTSHRERRLLLTNFDLGIPIPSGAIQLGLDFSESLPEFFTGREMGEDALRVLSECIARSSDIRAAVARETPVLKKALRWIQTLHGRPTSHWVDKTLETPLDALPFAQRRTVETGRRA